LGSGAPAVLGGVVTVLCADVTAVGVGVGGLGTSPTFAGSACGVGVGAFAVSDGGNGVEGFVRFGGAVGFVGFDGVGSAPVVVLSTVFMAFGTTDGAAGVAFVVELGTIDTVWATSAEARGSGGGERVFTLAGAASCATLAAVPAAGATSIESLPAAAFPGAALMTAFRRPTVVALELV
jgi:hypothetical protein